MYKILLVEDEIKIRNGLKKLLEEIIGGFKVIGQVSNGIQALEWLKSNVADIIISDIQMKEMDGIELIKRIREQLSTIPIIIISGYGYFDYAKQALKYNVTDFLLKPIDRVELSQSLYMIKEKMEMNEQEKTKSINTSLEAYDSKEERQIIRRAREIVTQRLDQEISLQYISNQLGLNHQYFSALFKSQTKQNFSDYVTECRMNKAKQLLKESNLKIYQIASLSGYVNAKHFMAVFKQHVGVTPSEYRDINRISPGEK